MDLYETLLKGKPNARAEAAQALGQAKGEKALEYLAKALDDDYSHVTAQARMALQAIGTDQAWSILRENPPKGMILVPAGEFIMGDDEGREDEQPAHSIYLPAFYIDQYPVTNADYKKFVECTGHSEPRHWRHGFPEDKADHPVVYVTWQDALAYAQWAGKRLPTEAEWEKAATWDEEKRAKRKYPWGDEFVPGEYSTAESGLWSTSPVGHHSPQSDSFYGVSDLTGSIWQWTNSLKREYPYRAEDGREDGREDLTASDFRIVRGGAWLPDAFSSRSAYRNASMPNLALIYIGLRCALDAVDL
jgi:formylglycine-generating enzyme required for sulfatase activity